MRSSFTRTVHPFDFGRLSGHEFERLVFAFLLRRWSWSALDWFGQSGDDGGRDIIGTRETDLGRPEKVVIACANWRTLTVAKATGDLDNLCKPEPPSAVIVVGGGAVSATTKTKITEHAKALRIYEIQVWSGTEFEEQLRFHAEAVVARFFGGEDLPDEPSALRDFVRVVSPDEPEALRLLARSFDRPAFLTTFHQESSIPAFRKALSDTIEAINTGIYRTRDGTEIRRLPSKHDFADEDVRLSLGNLVQLVVRLRASFDDHLRAGSVQLCGCDQPDCPTFTAEPVAIRDLDRRRREILSKLERITGVSIPHLIASESQVAGRTSARPACGAPRGSWTRTRLHVFSGDAKPV